MNGCIYRRGKKSWAIVFDVGATGKRKQKWHSVRGTKKDAERERTRLLNALETGTYVEQSKQTVSEYLDRWLRDYARTHVSAKTYERYEEIVKLHLKPALGHHMLTKLRALHIDSYYTQALKDGRMDGRSGGLSPRTVLHHHRVLRKALQKAVPWGFLVANPADGVEPPAQEHKEMRSLDEQAAANLLKFIRGNPLEVPIQLAMMAGMRRGEILGVRWEDIDLERSTLAVRQSLEQTKAGLRFKQPKSEKARLIGLPSLTVEALRRHKSEQAKTRLALGPAYEDHGLVCAGQDGRPWNPNAFSHRGVYLLGKAGLSGLRFHDLRHTHATLLFGQDVPPKLVSTRLGHSTIGITLDTYTHVLPGMDDEVMQRFDSAMRVSLAKADSK